MKKNIPLSIIKWLITLVIVGGYYWFMLPPINIRSRDFWSFVSFIIIISVVIHAFSQIVAVIKENKNPVKVAGVPKISLKSLGKPFKFALICVVAIIVLSSLASLIGAEIFNAKSYNNLITLTDGDFIDDVAEISQEQIPVVDKDTASRLGQRKLGEMSDLVSQFEIEEIYTQINYKGKPVRVTPLEYGDIIKWFNNRKQGIPAYITVDMTTQETNLVRLEKGIKYSASEYFMRDLYRALRFKYPTTIFDNFSF